MAVPCGVATQRILGVLLKQLAGGAILVKPRSFSRRKNNQIASSLQLAGVRGRWLLTTAFAVVSTPPNPCNCCRMPDKNGDPCM